MEPELENPETWVLVAFLIFIALVTKKAYLVITVALDARATRIREGLDDAARLREEAQSLLAQYQRQQRGAGSEIEAMLERARRDSALMLEAARTRLAAQLLQRENRQRKISRVLRLRWLTRFALLLLRWRWRPSNI